MKVIEKEIIKKEIVKTYESIDGKIFNSEEECKKYDETAYAVINAEFKSTIVKITTEYDLIGNKTGSEDYDIAIINIKNHGDLDKVNRMIQITNEKYHNRFTLLPDTRIGETIAHSLGYGYEKEYQYLGYCYGTKEEILKEIEDGLNQTFSTEKEKKDEN